MSLTEENKFTELIHTIRRRPQESFSGYWFNLIKYQDYHFIQGNIADEVSECGINRNIATLMDKIKPSKINGTWPEIMGYPVKESEEKFLVRYLSAQREGDIELIIPERNLAGSVSWGRFDLTGEFKYYESSIYPAIIEVLECLEFHTLLDAGCGSGNLLELIIDRFPHVTCCGIDNNNKNIEAAKQRHLSHIFLGDCERVDALLPDNLFFDMIVFCGLLNVQITSKEKANKILHAVMPRLKRGGHIIITGYSPCHFTAGDLEEKEITVLRRSIPKNIFKDYLNYHLRQLYLGRKQ
jgi:SAM-dependent methyltransferase